MSSGVLTHWKYLRKMPRRWAYKAWMQNLQRIKGWVAWKWIWIEQNKRPRYSEHEIPTRSSKKLTDFIGQTATSRIYSHSLMKSWQDSFICLGPHTQHLERFLNTASARLGTANDWRSFVCLGPHKFLLYVVWFFTVIFAFVCRLFCPGLTSFFSMLSLSLLVSIANLIVVETISWEGRQLKCFPCAKDKSPHLLTFLPTKNIATLFQPFSLLKLSKCA